MAGPTGRRLRVAAPIAALLVALTLLGWGYRQLQAPRAELSSIRDGVVGSVPVTIWTPPRPRGPVVVVVHGLAGSRQVMQPYALTLARAGLTTLTLDLPGHGANPQRLPSGDSPQRRAESLDRALDTVVGRARELGDGRVALVGHSMGADAVIRYAAGHRGVIAVVALAPGADLPHGQVAVPDLLVLTGEYDAGSRPVAERIAAGITPAQSSAAPAAGTAAGTARRVTIVRGIEHVGILFSGTALELTRDWLSGSAAPHGVAAGGTTPGHGFVDHGLPPLALVYGGGGILLVLLAVTLPGRIGTAPRRRRLPGDPSWWAAAALPAVGGALAAAVVPVERLLPIAVAGRLALLLATQGVLALLFLRLTRAAAFASILPLAPSRWTTVLRTTLIVLAVLAALTVTVGYPTQTYLLQVLPAGDRWWLLTICAAAAVPYAIADAALTAHRGAPRAAGVITLSGLFAAWLVAIVLAPGELGFLLVVGPLLAAFLTCCTMLAALVRRCTGLVAPGVAIRSLTFGWIVCVTFPLAA